MFQSTMHYPTLFYIFNYRLQLFMSQGGKSIKDIQMKGNDCCARRDAETQKMKQFHGLCLEYRHKYRYSISRISIEILKTVLIVCARP